MESLLIIAAIVVVGVFLLFVGAVTRTSKLNVDPLQDHLMRIVAGLNDNGHTEENRERFTSLAAGYFHHFGIRSPGEIQTRLAHALSFVKLRLMPQEYEEMRRFLRAWTMPVSLPSERCSDPKNVTKVGVPDVFLSYAREDRDAAKIVVAQLEANEFMVWWDDGIQTGDRWEAEIKRQLDQAASVVVLWTGFASVSEWVRLEAKHGRDQQKLVPAYLRRCRLPTAFEDLQTSDLSGWDGDPSHSEWVKLVAAIKRRAASTRNVKT